MAVANGTCTCGRAIVQAAGRGRPRKRCGTCSPPKDPGSSTYVRRAKPSRQCAGCGVLFSRSPLAKFCSDACKHKTRWISDERVPCSLCAGPTGYQVGAVAKATCLTCRRTRAGYRVRTGPAVEDFTCDTCTSVFQRVRMRGARPKRCGDCLRAQGNARIGSRASVRDIVYRRDGWICWLCQGEVDSELRGTKSPWRPSLDHVTPVSLGGSDEESNLRLAHQWCNSIRGDGHKYSPEDFRVAS